MASEAAGERNAKQRFGKNKSVRGDKVNTIHIAIQAYNAEKTLARAIDSVIKQTYKNFVIYVCDDASTDSTPNIIRDYEKRGLIKAYFNDTNGIYSDSGKAFLDVKNHISDDDFYAVLDADDELYPENFERLITFANENDLDIAAAGYDIYDIPTGQVKTYDFFARQNEKLCFENPEDYRANFTALYQYSWSMCSKLFRGNLSGELQNTIANFGYGHDSVNVLSAMTKARRIGVFPEQLYLYYTGGGSNISSRYDSKRIYLPETVFGLIKNLLFNKLNVTTIDSFIYSACYNIYLNQVIETLNYNLNMDIATDIKLSEINYLAGSETCRAFYRDNDYFKLVATNRLNEDVFYLPLEWIYKNFRALPPRSAEELYHVFFDTVFQTKEPKFSYAEIDFLIQFDIRVINSIFCGEFAAPAKLLEKLPESEMRDSILGKVKRYLV
jgi:glycosyltransferase involved in cell wall biosynthesis